eukprot:scaffold112414_cov60-Phaeocystis_antarctica.AAC.1
MAGCFYCKFTNPVSNLIKKLKVERGMCTYFYVSGTGRAARSLGLIGSQSTGSDPAAAAAHESPAAARGDHP